MDQQKIGAFMAACRKRKKLTQRQLAEALGVTDRSVSNWENGVCLPDASLYHSLCELLQISIEEFFAGDFLPRGTGAKCGGQPSAAFAGTPVV